VKNTQFSNLKKQSGEYFFHKKLHVSRLIHELKNSESAVRTALIFFAAVCIGLLTNWLSMMLLDNRLVESGGGDSETITAIKAVNSQYLTVITVMMVVFIVVVFFLLMFLNSLRQIRRRVGLEVEYVEVEPNESQALIYRKVSKFIRSATSSVVVVNSVVPEIHNGDCATQKARGEYLNTLLSVANTKRPFFYKRVWQVVDVENPTEVLQEHWNTREMIQHVDSIAKQREQNNDSSVMFTAPACRMGTFILIDDDRMIWQISEYWNPEDTDEEQRDVRHTKVKGVFLITDPYHVITGHFKDSTVRILQRGRLVSYQNMEKISNLSAEKLASGNKTDSAVEVANGGKKTVKKKRNAKKQ